MEVLPPSCSPHRPSAVEPETCREGEPQSTLPLEPTGGFGRSLFTSLPLPEAAKSGFVIFFFFQKAPVLEPD